MSSIDEHLKPAEDHEELQAAVLAAAIDGDEYCRGQLSSIYSGFEEPYRSVASVLLDAIRGGGFIDRHTVEASLDGKLLTRRSAGGKNVSLTAKETIKLICSGKGKAEGAIAYVEILKKRLNDTRRTELKERVQELSRSHGDSPEKLIDALRPLVGQARASDIPPSEAFVFIPYFNGLVGIQKGTEFLGLDSGFPLLNRATDGLNTGLWVIAAAPSTGKTTLAFQICQQVAENSNVPVIFVSFEQSAGELRTKALARFAKMDNRHIARGRMRSDNPEDMGKLMLAAERYFNLGRNLKIIEGDDTTTIDRIGEIAAAEMSKTGAKRCLIVIDYLQIIPVQRLDAARVNSAKDRVDLHVSCLRRLARQLDSPVVAISSENRGGYDQKRLNVFKESGGIEYSADIAAVMTKGVGGGDKYRAVDFNIVKNRNGALSVIEFKFYPERAEFVESKRRDYQDEN